MASQLTHDVSLAAVDLTGNTATQLHNLGERVVTPDGRSFRYAKAGAVDLVAGTLLQASAQVANHQNLTATAAAAGATSVTVTLGGTAATANQYAGGYVMVTVTPDQGKQYLVLSNPAQTNGSGTLTLQLADPIVTAWTTGTRVDLIANPYNGVLINPSTASSTPVGVAQVVITAAQYGWIQVGGVANILADGAVTVGTSLVASNATAGAVEALTGVQAVVGIAVTDISTTEYGAVRIFLS